MSSILFAPTVFLLRAHVSVLARSVSSGTVVATSVRAVLLNLWAPVTSFHPNSITSLPCQINSSWHTSVLNKETSPMLGSLGPQSYLQTTRLIRRRCCLLQLRLQTRRPRSHLKWRKEIAKTLNFIPFLHLRKAKTNEILFNFLLRKFDLLDLFCYFSDIVRASYFNREAPFPSWCQHEKKKERSKYCRLQLSWDLASIFLAKKCFLASFLLAFFTVLSTFF